MSRSKERSGSKMATFKKKQDDKNLKTLRELASLCSNKQCFDCYQKGPTYINMTIGSFVCTSCSGLLRGLNPPHRVKSISMATFTPDEIDFIKARGNEYCRSVWMGRYDKGRGLDEGSFKDETQMKDYLNLKYEKKRWYISPSEVAKTMDSSSAHKIINDGRTDQVAIDESVTTVNQVRSRPVNNRPLEQQQPAMAPKETLFIFDVDPFSPSSVNEQPKMSNNATTGFANFANFESHAFQSTSLTPLKPDSDSAIANDPFASHPAVTVSSGSCVDKYSALAELDELFRNDSGTTAATGSLFVARSPVGSQLHAFDSTFTSAHSMATTAPVNPFFPQSTTAAKPADSSPFASLNPFGEQQQQQQTLHSLFNGSPKAPSSTTPNVNNVQQSTSMQFNNNNWNPFI